MKEETLVKWYEIYSNLELGYKDAMERQFKFYTWLFLTILGGTVYLVIAKGSQSLLTGGVFICAGGLILLLRLVGTKAAVVTYTKYQKAYEKRLIREIELSNLSGIEQTDDPMHKYNAFRESNLMSKKQTAIIIQSTAFLWILIGMCFIALHYKCSFIESLINGIF